MRKRKFVLLSLGVIAVVALLTVPIAISQAQEITQCTSKVMSKTGSLVQGDFIVTVDKQTDNGLTILTYSVSSPTGENLNKFGAWVMSGLQFEQGFSTLNTGNQTAGSYLTPDNQDSGFPPEAAWSFDQHQDLVVWPSVAIGNSLVFKAKERYKQAESNTSILLGWKNTYQICGPIEGFTNPAAPTFNGNPISFQKATVTMEDGCIYDFYAGERDNIINRVEVNSESPPNETNGCDPSVSDPTDPTFCKACQVIDSPGICEDDTGLERCPEVELGRPPLQSVPGGWCYFPYNYKIPC